MSKTPKSIRIPLNQVEVYKVDEVMRFPLKWNGRKYEVVMFPTDKIKKLTKN